MKIDPENCRDIDLLAAEVRRLQAVIAASEPALTDAERRAVEEASDFYIGTRTGVALRGLLERMGAGGE